MFGKMMSEKLGKAHFWSSATFITLVFCGQLLAGYSGQQRRLFDPFQYDFLKHLQGLNRLTSYFAFSLAASQLFFVWNFFSALIAGKKAPENPWEVGTLEWQIPSPPPFHTFDKVPTIHWGPHEFSNPDVQKATGRDWIGQQEELPQSAGEGGASGLAASAAE